MTKKNWLKRNYYIEIVCTEIGDSHHHLQSYIVFGSCPATSSEPSKTSIIREIIETIKMHNYNSLCNAMQVLKTH